MSNSNYIGQVITFGRRASAKRDLDLEISEVGGASTRLVWATGCAQASTRLVWATGSAQNSTRLVWATGSAQNATRLVWATGSAGSVKSVAAVAA